MVSEMQKIILTISKKWANTGGNVLVKTIKGSKDLAKLNSDVNLLDYKLSADNIDEAVNGINALKLNVTSFSIDKAKKTIDLSVKFIGGEEEWKINQKILLLL